MRKYWSNELEGGMYSWGIFSSASSITFEARRRPNRRALGSVSGERVEEEKDERYCVVRELGWEGDGGESAR